MDFVEFYGQNVRGPMFTGMVAMASILFGLQNFLLINLNRDIYGKRRYRDYARDLEPHSHPLDRLHVLARRIQRTTSACFLAGLLQFTLGFYPAEWAVIVCVSAAIVVLVMLGQMYYLQIRVVDSWLDYLKWEADRDDHDAEEVARDAA